MEIYNHLTTLRHHIRDEMLHIRNFLRRLINDPTQVSDVMVFIGGGKLTPKVISAQYRKEADPLIALLPEEWAIPVMQQHKNVSAHLDNLNTALDRLLIPQEDFALLRTQILNVEARFEKDTELFKQEIYQTAKGMIKHHA